MQKYISFFLLLLSLLALYIILYVGLDIFWPLGHCKNAYKINTIAINLSYSYIIGYIVYLLSVRLPQIYVDFKLKPVIYEKIKSLEVLYANILAGFPSNEDPLIIDIKNIQHCKKIMEDADWNTPNNFPFYPDTHNALFQTFFADYTEIKYFLNQIISDYKSQLSTEQLILIENLRSPSFMSSLDILVKSNVKFPSQGQQFIVDEFINLLPTVSKLENSFKDYSLSIKNFTNKGQSSN